MTFRTIARLGLATAIMLTAATAPAQVVTYSTVGSFTAGVFGATTCTTTACTTDGFTLSFLGAPSTSYFAPTLVDLGQFSTSYTPVGGTAGPINFGAGVNFLLTITQTVPGGGSSSFTDGITGSLRYNPSGSTLAWSPTAPSVSIGAATYSLIRDITNNIQIQAPTTVDNPNQTSVKANVAVSVVPEPSSFVLAAVGLAGLAVASRSRRRATKA